MLALRDIALSAIVTGVTIAIGLVILAQFQTVIYQVESGGTGGYGSAYNATTTTIAAVGGLPDWLNIYVVAGAGFAILGLILAGMQFGRQE
jgi:hypothetical protein